MDPLTLAANRFLREHETAWSPPPEVLVPKVLRLKAGEAHRGDILKSLRLLEWQPECRRPIAIVEVPFSDPTTYARIVLSAVRDDVSKVEGGLREEDLTLGQVPPPLHERGIGPFVAELESLAAAVARVLDGLVVVLAPRTVASPTSFASFVEGVVAARTGTAALRLDVLACNCPGLDEVPSAEARFDVDEGELFRYLRDMGAKSSAGPKDDGPSLSAEQRKQIEAELGQPIVSLDAGRTLKRLLMDGGKALHDGRPKEAVRKYRAARSLTEATGLKKERLATTMALGTAYATLQNYRGAQASFERARRQAADIERPDLEAQALFGLGFVYMLEKRYREAGAIYQAIASSVPDDSPLKREALRLVEAAKRGDFSYGTSEVAP
ncbi:MAG: tetratricopeptide repeat protein [Polyangiaceae bacterium]|nr:tetratricopeptide repeat protein [Polyangiaceae bacterium]